MNGTGQLAIHPGKGGIYLPTRLLHRSKFSFSFHM